MLDETEKCRYRCQLALPQVGEAGQIKLKSARVLCIGAGGLGTVLLQYLAAAGVGTIGIVDDDVIEPSNLQRQIIYHPQQIGMKKVAAAKHYLTQLNPACHVMIHDAKFSSRNAEALIADYDIVADCTDVLANRYLTNTVCLAGKKPFVFAGISQFQGQCMLFRGHSDPCFECVFPSDSEFSLGSDCASGGVLAVLPGMLGLMQASLIMRHLLLLDAAEAPRLHTVDLLSFEFEHYQVQKNPDCLACQHRQAQPSVIYFSELLNKMDAGEAFTLLDVRTHQERAAGHLGGLHIPLHELAQRLGEIPQSKPVIIYCHTDKRSAAAAKMLMPLSFPLVAYLEGGIMAARHHFSMASNMSIAGESSGSG